MSVLASASLLHVCLITPINIVPLTKRPSSCKLQGHVNGHMTRKYCDCIVHEREVRTRLQRCNNGLVKVTSILRCISIIQKCHEV